MSNWRRGRGGFGHREWQGVKSQNGRSNYESWQPTVPAWEKSFCSSVGISWNKLLEGKRYMHIYENVMQWNDSAGEEAFNNAKKRFWAEINHLECEIPLPDPDAYIGEIDWDAKVDPELLLDVEDAYVQLIEVEKKEVALNRPLSSIEKIVPTGWRDEFDEEKKDALVLSNLESKESAQCGDKNQNPWERNYETNVRHTEARGWGNNWNSGWGNNWNNLWENNQLEKNVNGCRVSHGMSNALDDWSGRDRCIGNGFGRMRESPSWYMSRYKTKRFHCEEYQLNRGWMKGRGQNRVNYVHE